MGEGGAGRIVDTGYVFFVNNVSTMIDYGTLHCFGRVGGWRFFRPAFCCSCCRLSSFLLLLWAWRDSDSDSLVFFFLTGREEGKAEGGGGEGTKRERLCV